MLQIGSITTSCVTNKGFKKVTQGELMNSSLSMQLKKTSKSKTNKQQANKKKKQKPVGKVFASGSTSKSKLLSLKRKLRSKLAELTCGQDGEQDQFKELRAARIRSQIDAIDRMINGLAKAEKEKEIKEKQKKKSKESLWISKRDLKASDHAEKQLYGSVTISGQPGPFCSDKNIMPSAPTGSTQTADAVIEGDVGSNVDVSL